MLTPSTSRHVPIAASLAAILLLALPAPAAAAAQDSGPVNNTMCPVSDEAVEAGDGPVVSVDGRDIQLCCKMCKRKWDGYSDEQKRSALAEAIQSTQAASGAAHVPSADEPEEATGATQTATAPYPLTVCIMSGEELGEDPVTKTIDGREVRFCCKRCASKFEADPKAGFAKLDAKIIEDQLPLYPLDTCVVAGGKIGGMGEPVDIVHDGRLVRFCCAKCKGKFEKDAAMYLRQLDAAVVRAQAKDYALTTCPVSHEELSEGHGTIDIVVAGRLVRFCCADCSLTVNENAAELIRAVDAARAAKASAAPETPAAPSERDAGDEADGG